MYFGEVNKRYELVLKLDRIFKYTTHYTFYGENNYIYSFTDDDGNVFVWKTTAYMGIDKVNERGNIVFDACRERDTVKVKATVKEHSEYKGTEQTVLTRVKVLEIDHAPTKEELDAEKAKMQMESLEEGDFVWRAMPYKQYKEHYADCETVAGSYVNKMEQGSFIDVIIRRGRLKASGTRFKTYHSWSFMVDGKITSGYYAVSYENAEKRCRKEHPEAQNIELHKMYF